MDENEIKKILANEFEITGKMTISNTGVIDVDGDVTANFINSYKQLPVQFGKVSGSFSMEISGLSSLIGCPREVGGDFSCQLNFIQTLEGGPSLVGGTFDAALNPLISLKGLPSKIGHSKNAGRQSIVNLSYDDNLGLLGLITNDIAYQNSSGSPLTLNSSKPEALTIITKYINNRGTTPGSRRAAAIKCSIELIRSGFRGNAKM